MLFNFLETLFALSDPLDCVEHDVFGVTGNHGKRVAAVSVAMAQELGLPRTQLQALAACALMHDCGLTEYMQQEFGGSALLAARETSPDKLGIHCWMGELHLRALPFDPALTANVVLCHHENADGSGPFGKRAEDTPLFARILHLADTADTVFDLSWMNDQKQEALDTYLEQNQGKLFDEQLVSLFRRAFDEKALVELRNEKLDMRLRELLPACNQLCTPQQLIDFGRVFAFVTDCKSKYTHIHSVGIAQKAKQMAEYYGADEETSARMYLAGALHDIGRLVIDRDVLEKPDRLSESEYRHVKTHVYHTYRILSEAPGLEDVTLWSAYHHERLDGTGYPFGLKADRLNTWERMMACLDIYQALTEERPYKHGMSHNDAMGILVRMAASGKLDAHITDDIGWLFAPAS
jgi:HD-GYP domain-containing protein (c-di-GMP phosphodiesterase class II)